MPKKVNPRATLSWLDPDTKVGSQDYGLQVVAIASPTSIRYVTPFVLVSPITAEVDVLSWEGNGYVDHIVCRVAKGADSAVTGFRFYADDVLCFYESPLDLDNWGYSVETSPISVYYVHDDWCSIIVSKRFDFKKSFKITAHNNFNTQLVYVRAYPSLYFEL